MTIPIFIIVHNQYEILRRIVTCYEKSISTPIEIIFHDVASTYYETVLYLQQQKKDGYKVYHSSKNDHHTVVESIDHYLEHHPDCEYVVLTDPDIELFNVQPDILDVYIHVLRTLQKTSVGPMLEIDDIPDSYYNKEAAVAGHTLQFWNRPQQTVVYKDRAYRYVECRTDTTFQLFSAKNVPSTFPHDNSVRMLSPYSAKHLDWYIDANNLYPCQLFYAMTTSTISHWNNPKWKGIYYRKHLRTLHDSFKNSIQYVYYHNNYNFGDYITSFIYERLFHKSPILNIHGGPKNSDVVFGAGNILGSAKPNSVVWGTGLMFGNEHLPKPRRILSVRGPLTRRRLQELGYSCPEKYGDIGLILPYVYYPPVRKKYALGIIPHCIEAPLLKQFIDTDDTRVLLIDVTDTIEVVIQNILQCHHIASSSLYGIIVSHAYNIPALWIKLSNKIGGGGFRYRDYYGSIGIDNYRKLNPFEITKQTALEHIVQHLETYPNPEFPLHTKHILQLCPFINVV